MGLSEFKKMSFQESLVDAGEDNNVGMQLEA